MLNVSAGSLAPSAEIIGKASAVFVVGPLAGNSPSAGGLFGGYIMETILLIMYRNPDTYFAGSMNPVLTS